MDIPSGAGLEDKTALVVGGGARGDGIGNGRAAALLLAHEGANVIVVDRRLALAERTVEMIGDAGGTASALEADVTDAAQCEAMVAQTLARFSRLDVLVNNVGIGSRGSVVDEDLETWERVMQVNVTTMFLASKYAIPAIIASGGGAYIEYCLRSENPL